MLSFWPSPVLLRGSASLLCLDSPCSSSLPGPPSSPPAPPPQLLKCSSGVASQEASASDPGQVKGPLSAHAISWTDLLPPCDDNHLVMSGCSVLLPVAASQSGRLVIEVTRRMDEWRHRGLISYLTEPLPHSQVPPPESSMAQWKSQNLKMTNVGFGVQKQKALGVEIQEAKWFLKSRIPTRPRHTSHGQSKDPAF